MFYASYNTPKVGINNYYCNLQCFCNNQLGIILHYCITVMNFKPSFATRSFVSALHFLYPYKNFFSMLCDVSVQGPRKENSLSAKIFIEAVTIFLQFFFFARDLEEFLSPIFHHALNVGLPSFMFLRWCMQYTEREHPKQVL